MSAGGHAFHNSLLREYDIRGVVGETLFESDAYNLGRAFGTIVRRENGSTVAVCRDGRLTSPALEAALVAGLVDCGIEVHRIGLGPTPMLYFSSHLLKADGAIQVTGSHNPPDHNGFKMVLRNKPFYGQSIQSLGRMAEASDYISGRGKTVEQPVENQYIERLLADFVVGRPLKVVWDAGNGAAGAVLDKLIQRLPGQHTLLFGDIDGNFPNHHPDPTDPETLRSLQAKIAETNADIGFAFDGDGDRIGVVDGKGRILFGDQIMILLSESVLAERPGATIIADVKASEALFDEIDRLGGVPLMWRTGHSLIKTKIAECNAPLAGEMSGHIFFNDRYYGYDDALYAAIRFLSIAANYTESLAERYDRLPHLVNTPELRLPCPDDRKQKVMAAIKEMLVRQGVAFDDTDGVRVKDGGGWWLLRSSNTQAILVARAEAPDRPALEQLVKNIGSYLESCGMADGGVAVAEAAGLTSAIH